MQYVVRKEEDVLSGALVSMTCASGCAGLEEYTTGVLWAKKYYFLRVSFRRCSRLEHVFVVPVGALRPGDRFFIFAATIRDVPLDVLHTCNHLYPPRHRTVRNAIRGNVVSALDVCLVEAHLSVI